MREDFELEGEPRTTVRPRLSLGVVGGSSVLTLPDCSIQPPRTSAPSPRSTTNVLQPWRVTSATRSPRWTPAFKRCPCLATSATLTVIRTELCVAWWRKACVRRPSAPSSKAPASGKGVPSPVARAPSYFPVSTFPLTHSSLSLSSANAFCRVRPPLGPQVRACSWFPEGHKLTHAHVSGGDDSDVFGVVKKARADRNPASVKKAPAGSLPVRGNITRATRAANLVSPSSVGRSFGTLGVAGRLCQRVEPADP